MKNVLTIFKKEWDRVIKDRRLVFTVMLLPGLMIFLIYTFIGTAVTNSTTQTIRNIAIVNASLTYKNYYDPLIDSNYTNVISITEDEEASYESQIDQGSWELLVILDPNIDMFDGNGDKPQVTMYYNPNETQSIYAYQTFHQALLNYENDRSIEIYSDTRAFVIAVSGTEVNQQQQMGIIISSILPMLVVMFLFSGAMSIGPESIAGEKERNTFSTLLITPVKRSEIALGKVLSLSVLSLLSALSSFFGILMSLPKLLQLEGTNMNIYSIGDYALILVVLFSTVFVIVGMISILSAYSRSVKEATTTIMPLYIITILVSVTSLFNDNVSQNYLMYLVPIYNTVQTLSASLSFNPERGIYALITVVANLGYLALFVSILRRMFESEKIMFLR